MAPTPRPEGWKGGSEDFGFLRTLDGHISNDRVGSSLKARERFGFANVRWGFDEADLSGDYEPEGSVEFDLHDDERG